VVAVVEVVVELVDVVVGVELVVLVGVLLDVEVEVLVLVEVEVLDVEDVLVLRCRQSCWASWEMVEAAWLRLLRNVELIVTGSVCTWLLRTALALTAAPQLVDCTAETTWSAWLLSAFD
jgi:hypothetical protein